MPHNAKTIPNHREQQDNTGSIMQHNAYPLSITPEYCHLRVPLWLSILGEVVLILILILILIPILIPILILYCTILYYNRLY